MESGEASEDVPMLDFAAIAAQYLKRRGELLEKKRLEEEKAAAEAAALDVEAAKRQLLIELDELEELLAQKLRGSKPVATPVRNAMLPLPVPAESPALRKR